MYCGLDSMLPRNSASGVSLFSGVPMSRDLVREGAEGAQEGPPARRKFLKQGLKQGCILSKLQRVEVETGSLKFTHQSVI